MLKVTFATSAKILLGESKETYTKALFQEWENGCHVYGDETQCDSFMKAVKLHSSMLKNNLIAHVATPSQSLRKRTEMKFTLNLTNFFNPLFSVCFIDSAISIMKPSIMTIIS
jgi:hypothetical protein